MVFLPTLSTHSNRCERCCCVDHAMITPSSNHMILWAKNDIVLENLQWPKLSWYVKFIVDHNNSMKRCTIDNMWVRGVLNYNVFLTLFTHFIPQNLAHIIKHESMHMWAKLHLTQETQGVGWWLGTYVCAHTHTHTWLPFLLGRLENFTLWFANDTHFVSILFQFVKLGL